jgi:hypothetical protein
MREEREEKSEGRKKAEANPEGEGRRKEGREEREGIN